MINKEHSLILLKLERHAYYKNYLSLLTNLSILRSQKPHSSKPADLTKWNKKIKEVKDNVNEAKKQRDELDSLIKLEELL